MQINYSIIIPHKNIPVLLQRCLDSITRREDAQIIVVDDNSDASIVDFDHFPGMDRDDVEVIFTKEGNGAGYARNVGLNIAIGKWVLFIDADDFFSDKYNEILDSSIDAKEDLLLFDYMTVMSEDPSKPSHRNSLFHQFIEDYLMDSSDESKVRYSYHLLLGKIIRRSILEWNCIRCSETRWSNDILFSTKVGYFASSIVVSNSVLYIQTERKGSLTSNFCGTRNEFSTRLMEAIKSESFLRSHAIYPTIRESELLIKYVRAHYGRARLIKWAICQKPFSKVQNCVIRYLLSRMKAKLE